MSLTKKSRSLRFGPVLAFVSLGFVIGSCFQFPGKAEKGPYRELEKFSKILEYIERNYVDSVESSKLMEGAINGMLHTLDPHSAYLTPKLYKDMKSETSGKFGGLGLEVSVKDSVITVVAPIEDTPAFRAGIKAGDKIVKIEGKLTKTMNLAEAISLMRGKPGSKVSVSIARAGVNKPLDFVLTRESIKVRSVRSLLFQKDVGYLRISSFAERTAKELEDAIKKIESEGNIKGWVLDMRGNPGGLLDQAVKISNLFINEGPIVYTIGRDKQKKEIEYARKGNKVTDLPVVVLVDSSSASASEIVAGALQDHGRAVIAGQQTFGKGSVQTIIPVGDEAGLKLTIARYYTPSGRSIQVKGITPDFELDYIDQKTLAGIRAKTRSVREVDLEGHFDNEAKEAQAAAAKAEAASPEDMTFEERVEKDYMLSQASGILRTMSMTKQGSKLPEFKMEETPPEAKASPGSAEAPKE